MSIGGRHLQSLQMLIQLRTSGMSSKIHEVRSQASQQRRTCKWNCRVLEDCGPGEVQKKYKIFLRKVLPKIIELEGATTGYVLLTELLLVLCCCNFN